MSSVESAGKAALEIEQLSVTYGGIRYSTDV